MNRSKASRPILVVTAASDIAQLQQYLLRSPPIANKSVRLHAVFNADSAAAAINPVLRGAAASDDELYPWIVWAHQDVYLPDQWEARLISAIERTEKIFPLVAVIGVYGITRNGARAGHLLDRGQLLQEPASLPCLVDSIDELCFAIRYKSQLLLDPKLGFDFYATDLVLQAGEMGLQAAVVDAYCEHWSSTPLSAANASESLVNRILASADTFERKWSNRMPIHTTCFDIRQIGDVRRTTETWQSRYPAT